MGRFARPPEVREPIMNVGDAAQRSGLPAKTIRYYEEIGLIRPARAGNGYRDYSGDDIHRLTFLRRARNLGFSIDDCRQLMALYQDRSRASHDVREIAAAHVTAIEEKVRELQSMRSILQRPRTGGPYDPGGRYRIDFALPSACIVSSTLRRTVVSCELSAPPAPIASMTDAIETLSGASHRFQPSCSPKAYQNPCSFPPTDSM
jgi:MerR family transcriptional regulator, copper efflux regulator